MDNIQKRAHDFAIAAMQCYQEIEIAKAQDFRKKPDYDLVKLRQIYDEAFLEMEYRLKEKQENHSS